ncbi:hypothetical protein PMA3_07965 [Pseudomonas silesiensis]|uniref:Uncharacterized protein n=1 Tax=Pseudomonas silesiensis TaxID=1853130 RepID=A0A191YQV3_9PSED|nr:hypothetical protein PMA3_07965 [Pseudomonas silesiensis]
MKAFAYAHFAAYVTNIFLLMIVVIQPKPLYLMVVLGSETAADQSVAGNDIMRAKTCNLTDRQRAL